MDMVLYFGKSLWKAKEYFCNKKRILRSMTGASSRATCRKLFCEFNILTLTSQYIFSLMRFLSSNLDTFTFNSSIHNLNTQFRLKLHKPSVNLKMYQHGTYYNCINIYNKLPEDLASQIQNKSQFLLQLKRYLMDKPYYSLQEFFEHSTDP